MVWHSTYLPFYRPTAKANASLSTVNNSNYHPKLIPGWSVPVMLR